MTFDKIIAGLQEQLRREYVVVGRSSADLDPRACSFVRLAREPDGTNMDVLGPISAQDALVFGELWDLGCYDVLERRQ